MSRGRESRQTQACTPYTLSLSIQCPHHLWILCICDMRVITRWGPGICTCSTMSHHNRVFFIRCLGYFYAVTTKPDSCSRNTGSVWPREGSSHTLMQKVLQSQLSMLWLRFRSAVTSGISWLLAMSQERPWNRAASCLWKPCVTKDQTSQTL